MVSFYEGNENMNKTPDLALLQAINKTDIDATTQLYTNSLNLFNSSNKILTSLETNDNAIDKLQMERLNLENLFNNITVQQNKIRQQISSQLGTNANTINGNKISIEEWIKTADFKTYNTNKIKTITVYFNPEVILGIKIIKLNGSQEIKGNINNSQDSQSIYFEDSEFLTQIQIVTDTTIIGLCKKISFYTNLKGDTAKATIPETTAQQQVSNKIYHFSGQQLTWVEHKKKAEDMGYTLVCFKDKNENDLINTRYKTHIWIGLYHENVDKGLTIGTRSIENNAGWKWVDGTPYEKSKSNWWGGEPNNCCSGEPVINMWSNGTWNDHNMTAKFPAVYQKKIEASNNKTAYFAGEQIINFDFNPINADYDKIYNLDLEAIKNSQNVTQEMKNSINTIYETSDTMTSAITLFDGVKRNILDSIKYIDLRITTIIELNNAGEEYLNKEKQYAKDSKKQGFNNMENNPLTTSLSKLFNMFFNSKEGMQPDIAEFQRAHQNIRTTANANLIPTIQALDTIKDREINNAFSEFIIKKDNIFNNVLTDYMLNNEKQANIENVYNKLNQKNDDKMRKIEINTYYNKAYQEYFNVLKVIILVCIIIVPIIIANKNLMIPDSITMFLIVAIIVVTIIYIFYKFSDIYMRDSADFDKMKIPYDRDASALQKQGLITKKKNLLTSLTLTCIGEDCCDGSMVYDYAKNKCIATENFGNYFDKKINEIKTTIVEPMNNDINKQYLVANSLNCSDKDKFQSSACNNLRIG